LDDLVAYIDTPRLNFLYITFFNDIVFDTPQFIQFISRTPMLKALEKVHIKFNRGSASVDFSSLTSAVCMSISCRELDWQVSSVVQVCTSCMPPLSTLEHLYIRGVTPLRAHWQDVENALWLGLLHPFSAVKNLYVDEESAQRILIALRELIGDRVTEVLPALQNIFLERLMPLAPAQDLLRHFVTMRQVTGHPVAVSHWDTK
jgi:hypothetical protein